ncbi:MAG: hypothetical protein HY330_01950 [Chloroflexi bacterium]|nr:hypothetical protein [Chloroflexota bacterium]
MKLTRTWLAAGGATLALAVACGGAAAPTPTAAPRATAAPTVAPAAPTATASRPAAAPTATPAPAAAPTATPVAAKAAPKGHLRLATGGHGSQFLDPRQYLESSFFFDAYSIYDGLIEMARDGSLRPSLATEWRVRDDSLTWDFKLRRGVKFHNGDPFTAADVKYTFETYQGLGASELKATVDRIDTPDEATVIFHTVTPYPVMISQIGYTPTFVGWQVPKGYSERVGIEEFRKKPIGTGPFKFLEKRIGERQEYAANADHWEQAPKVARMTLLIAPDDTTRIAMLKTGEVEIAMGIPGPQIAAIRSTRGLRIVSNQTVSAIWHSFPDMLKPGLPLSDKRVRQAVNYAIDRQAIVDRLLFGEAQTAASVVSPGMFGFHKDLKPYPYDPRKARQLLAEAGYANGFEVNFHNTVGQESTGQAIADYLKEVGIKVNIRMYEGAAWVVRFREHTFDGIAYGSGSNVAGDGSYRVLTFIRCWDTKVVGQYSYVCNPEIEKLYEEQLKTVDQAKREQIVRRIQEIDYEEAGHLFLWYPKAVWGVSDKVLPWQPIQGMAWPLPTEELGFKD